MMNNLSLQNLNSKAPYTVLYGGQQSYKFKTDSNVLYDISFMEDMEISGCKSFQFSIRRLTTEYVGHDPKVKDTILAILVEFFEVNNDVLIYICDDTDGRESMRNRLFLRWFKEYDTKDRYEIKYADAVIEGKGFYTAIILRTDHPHFSYIIAEFDLVAAHLTDNKDK